MFSTNKHAIPIFSGVAKSPETIKSRPAQLFAFLIPAALFTHWKSALRLGICCVSWPRVLGKQPGGRRVVFEAAQLHLPRQREILFGTPLLEFHAAAFAYGAFSLWMHSAPLDRRGINWICTFYTLFFRHGNSPDARPRKS
jgi:hypothetical protein